MRWLGLVVLAVVLAVVISGCSGFGGNRGFTPLPAADFTALGQQMADIEHMKAPELRARREVLSKEIAATADKGIKSHDSFLIGYLEEFQGTQLDPKDPRNFRDAKVDYTNAVQFGAPYAVQASYRLGVLASNGVLEPADDALKLAKQYLRPLTTAFQVEVWVRSSAQQWQANGPPSMELAGMGGPATLVGEQAPLAAVKTPVLHGNVLSTVATGRLDLLYRTGGGVDQTYYQVVGIIVDQFKRLSPAYGLVLALFFLALVVKLLTMPLTTMAYRGMRDMQRIQPLLKDLQERYKDDKAKQAEEQMKLMKEHNVSATGGCLPMLIQLPIFIVVYQAVNVYAYEFSQAHFLWIKQLSLPDPALLVLYAVSMVITQKLTATPSADPQQQAIQKQMTYIMPLMLVLVLQTVASAFLLYWFFLNVLSSIHQYYLMRQFTQEDVTVPAPAPAIEAPKSTSRRKRKAENND